MLAVAGRVALREAVEQERQEFRRRCRGPGRRPRCAGRRLLAQRNADLAAGRRELDRVAEQVPEDLLQARAVGMDRPVARLDVELEAMAFGIGRRPHRVDRRADRFDRIDGLERQPHLAEVEARHVEDVGDHPRLDVAVALDRGEAADRLVVAAAQLQHVGPAHDRVERRAQLVRQHRDQVVLHPAHALGRAARDPLAVEQLLALLLEQDARRDVADDRHVDVGLDVRRDRPLEVDQLALRIDQRKLVRRAGGAALAGVRVDPLHPLLRHEFADPVADDRPHVAAQELQHRRIGVDECGRPGSAGRCRPAPANRSRGTWPRCGASPPRRRACGPAPARSRPAPPARPDASGRRRRPASRPRTLSSSVTKAADRWMIGSACGRRLRRSDPADLEAVDVGQVHVQHHGRDVPSIASPGPRCPVPASRASKAGRCAAGAPSSSGSPGRRRPPARSCCDRSIVPRGRRSRSSIGFARRVRPSACGQAQRQRSPRRSSRRRARSAARPCRPAARPAACSATGPRPVPRRRFWIGESTCAKSWKIAWWNSGAMPMPVSADRERAPMVVAARCAADAHLALRRELQRVAR